MRTIHEIKSKVANEVESLDKEFKRSRERIETDNLKAQNLVNNLKMENQTLKEKLEGVDVRINMLEK